MLPGPSTPPAAALRTNFGFAEGRGQGRREAESSFSSSSPEGLLDPDLRRGTVKASTSAFYP